MKSLRKLLFLPLAAACLAGCGFKDGEYTAQTAGPDSLGYRAGLSVTVADGKITDARFDAVNESGSLKSEDADYARLMKSVCGVTPSEISEHYRSLLLGQTRYGKVQVDAVSGATVSSREFAMLWQALEEPLKKGDEHSVVLPPAPEFPTPASAASENE